MATTKNITMKQFNGTDYDTLYPKTVYNQVSGVAPAGYGLGESTPTLISNCNIVGNGWYRVNASTANIPDVGLTSGVLRIDEATGSLVYQSLYFYVSGKVHKMERVHSNGTWYPWEWVNPPMVAGVEYRTTEWYLGKPVYTQVISIGAIGSGSGNVEHGIPDISVVVSLIGTNSYGPTLNTHPYMTVFYANSQYVRWETTQAISGTSYAVLRYTKTTD